jgi:Flp pilus assembly protein TadD
MGRARCEPGSWWWFATVSAALLTPHASSASTAAQREGVPATVMTLKGESISGRFLGATGAELTLETEDAVVAFPLRDVSYISFAGRPPLAGAVSYSRPTSPVAQLRLEGMNHERAGRLEEALRKYEEALKAEPSDPRAMQHVERVQYALRVRDAGTKAAPYKKLALALEQANRHREATACYDEAIRLDPYDTDFKKSLAALRYYWEPTTCPIGAGER